MSFTDTAVFGLELIAIGLVLVLAIVVLRLVIRRVQPFRRTETSQALFSSKIPPNSDAVLIIQPGGRVVYFNQQASDWLAYNRDRPNIDLDRLARRARPSEAFLELCYSEGQARFSLDGRMVEGTSYSVPYDAGKEHRGGNGHHSSNAMLVSLRRPQVAAISSGEAGISDQTLNIFAELSQSMAASLQLEATIQAILDSVERLIPSNFLEITVWDPDNRFLIPYRFVGQAGVDRHLERAMERYYPDKGYSGHLVTQRASLLIGNVDSFRTVRPAIDRKQYPFNSYMGVPLLMAGELLGTLELSSLARDAFSENDLELLQMLSRQATIALHNALLYQTEQHRIRELSGLAELAHAVGTLHDTQDLFARLVESITPLLDVNVLGFLLYNENRRTLEAQVPFVGIPQQFLQLYRTDIFAGSPAEEVWLKHETIATNNAPEESRLIALNLAHLAQATGIMNTVMEPLTSAGRVLGYLQVGDKKDSSPFDQNDLRLLEIIAGQSATIIDNAILIQQSQERAQRSEALRRIASLTGSSATLDEILRFSLRELARLLRADVAAILLLDETRGELRLHEESLFGKFADTVSSPEHISISDPLFRSTVTGGKRPYFTDNAADDPQILSLYKPITEALHIQSLIDVPLIVRDAGIGEVLIGNRTPNFFDRSDMGLVSTTASQLAAAIERSSLYTQTDESLRRSVEQLTALNRISRELNSTVDLEHLVQLVYDEVLRTTNASCGTISLFEIGEKTASPVKILLSIGDTPGKELSTLESTVVEKAEPAVVRDYVHLAEASVSWQPPHEGIQSSLVVPIAFQENVAGLIHVHSREAEHFDSTALQIVQSLAIQAAIALGNAQRYRDQIRRTELLNRRVDTMDKLREATRALRTDQPLEESMDAIVYGIQESTPFSVVLVSVYDPASGNLVRITGAGLPIDTLNSLRARTHPWNVIKQQLKPEYRVSNSYFIPYDQKPVIPAEIHTGLAMPVPGDSVKNSVYTWHNEDLLLVPLLRDGDEPLGMISLDAPRNGLRPDRPTIEAVEIFASQAILAIGSHKKFQELNTKADALRMESERAIQAAQTAQEHLPTLLHKDVEQSIAIQRISQRARRIRAGLDIAEIVNRQPDRSNALLALGQEILTRMDMDIALVAEPSAGGLRLLHALGAIPPNVNPEVLLGQRNPLRHSLQTGETILVPSLEGSDWQNTPLLVALETKAFICLPISLEQTTLDRGPEQSRSEERSSIEPQTNVDAVVLAISFTLLPNFTPEDQQVFGLVTRQAAITLENLRLLSETNRRLQEVNLLLEFSRQLGSLDQVSILQTLADSAMRVLPAAHAAMVALWKPDQEQLVPQIASGYVNNQRILGITYQSGEALPGQAFSSGDILRVNEVDFAKHYNLPPEHLLSYRDATGGRLPVSNLIVPIQTLDNKLGVLVLDNFTTPAAFTQDDQALITSLAQQTALALENARLYQASETRTMQLQTLTNVAATITSSLQTNELIASLLDQVRVILPYETGTLWLRRGNQLTIRAARGFEDSEERVGLSAAVEDSLLLKEMITTSKPISVPDVRNDARFPALVEPRYFSWLGVPLLSKGAVIGVIALEKAESSYYKDEHIQAMTTFAGQAAVALENANLFEESARRNLELDQRSRRLALLNRLSTELSGTLDPNNILDITIRELTQAINCSAVSAILFDATGQAVLQTEAPRVAEELPAPLPDAPLFERLRETLGIFNIEDIILESTLAPLNDFLTARGTKALLALSLATGSNLLGVLIAHADHVYRFTVDEVELARTIANQVAVAVQNARLFDETQRLFNETQQRTAELATLYELGMDVTQVLDQRRLMDITLENVARLQHAESVLLVMRNEADNTMTIDGIDRGERIGPLIRPITGKSFSEFVLSTGKPLLIGDIQSESEQLPASGDNIGDPARSWLGVPLIVRGATIGVLTVQSYQPNDFTESHQRLLVQIANQLAIALDNARLFTTAQDYTADLEARVAERTRQVESEHQRTQTLLSIITELSTSLDLDMVLNRTLAVINETMNAEHSLIMMMNPDESSLYLRASLGYTTPPPKGGQASSFKPGEGLVGWVINNRQPVLIPDLWKDTRWIRHDDQTNIHRSAIAVPLMMGEEVLGALLLFHRQPERFTPDQLELAQATAKQVTVAINNAQLFRLIRDQAERLGDMLRTQHIETSRSQAILEAVADGVLVTDVSGKITLFNASAEQILSLDRDEILGQSLDHFIGLFGKAAQSWMLTIRTWLEDPNSYQPGDTYAEQVVLDNRRVVSVHLSPVRLRNDFLGTVSIFRDITHQVEVDRLKSEFVATVSHELRTPMTSIKGYVEILLMGAAGSMSPQQVHFLEIVKSNTERLAVLVNDLLDVSRIEAGRVTLSLQALDLREVAEDVIATLSHRMQEEERPMKIELDIPSDLPRVYGDPERARQVLDNLLENAYQYTEIGGTINLRMHPEGDMMQIDVKDNGIGITLEEQKRVFERFYRGEDPLVLATSGTGLGLSIVNSLVDMHKGSLWLESSGIRGEGSVFSFTLPLYQEE
jgi:PAS domain S-box-containing protein